MIYRRICRLPKGVVINEDFTATVPILYLNEIETVLKQARDAVYALNDEYGGWDDLLASIEKFLGENK